MKYRGIYLLLIALLILVAPVSGQEIGEDLCGDCHSTGKIEHQHTKAALDLEKGSIYCSEFMRSDPSVLGMDWKVCPKCRTPSAQARAQREFDEEYARRKEWLDGVQKEVDERAGHRVCHILSKHFLIAWDIPKIKVDRRILKMHEAAHLYSERMEDLYQQVLEIHGITERDVRSTVHRLYMFEAQSTAKNVGPYVLDGGIGSSSRKSLIGPGSAMITYLKQEDFRTDESFHQFMVHVVSHHLHNEIRPANQWLAVRYGWVYVGLAHYMEIRNFGPPTTWCHREGGTFSHWKGKNWEGNVKKAVNAGTAPSFQDVIQKPSDVLTAEEHQFCWSYIDYLMWLDSHKIPELMGYMKVQQLPTRDAIRKTYGLTVGQFVDGWKAFVLDEYSTVSTKGPRVRPPRGPQ